MAAPTPVRGVDPGRPIERARHPRSRRRELVRRRDPRVDPLPAPGRAGGPCPRPACGANRGADCQPSIARSRPRPTRARRPAGHRARRAVGGRDARARGAGGRQDPRTGGAVDPIRRDRGPPTPRRGAGPQRDRSGCGLRDDDPAAGCRPLGQAEAPGASPNARRDRRSTGPAHAKRTPAGRARGCLGTRLRVRRPGRGERP
jgi:hypothetical protein